MKIGDLVYHDRYGYGVIVDFGNDPPLKRARCPVVFFTEIKSKVNCYCYPSTLKVIYESR